VGRGAVRNAALLAAVALTAWVHQRMPTPARSAQSDLFVPRPELARATALGFDAVIGDYYWLQAVQIVGGTGTPERKGYLLAGLIDVVTTLDPWVDHPYRFAAVWLTDSLASVRKANELLQRGIDHHPSDWRNRFYLGFNQFFYLGEEAKAAETLEPAIALQGAPRYLRSLVARLEGARGGLEAAETFLHGLILEAASDDEREQYERALDEVATERVARELDAARERYRERRGRDIEQVEDLLRGPDEVLEALPPEPHGGRWILSSEDGRIVSSAVGHRYEPNIDPVTRRRIEKIRAAGDPAPSTEGEGGR
jgi:hypothetical protein